MKLVLISLFSVFFSLANASAYPPLKEAEGRYGEKVQYARDTAVQFPDFILQFLGTGISSSCGRHVPIETCYFRVWKDGGENIISWSSGTGIIGPNYFEFGGKCYVIEKVLTTYGHEDENRKLNGPYALQENELVIQPAKEKRSQSKS